MIHATPIDALPDPEIDLFAWRRRTMDIVLWVIVAARFVHLVLFLTTALRSSGALKTDHLIMVSPFLLLLALACAKSLPLLLRGWGLLGLGYLHVAIAFAQVGRIEGFIPLTLVNQPVLAMILMGRKSAWTAAGLSIALFGLGAALLHTGLMPPPEPMLATSGPLQAWAVWLVIFVPLFTLQDRFIALFQRLLARERQTRTHLEEGIQERSILEHALLETTERERQSVGHELHDGVCQQITGAMLHCKAMEKAACEGQVPSPKSIQAVNTMLGASLGQVHDLARGLSPGTLTAETLLPSLRELARRTRETFELDCEVEAGDLPERLEPSQATHLYRIAQEALVNAVKHGEPTRIQISLHQEGGGLMLQVCNDGRPITASDGQGMGLRIMRHRSDLLGGILAMTSDGDSGVCITCTIPLAPCEVTA